MGRARAGIVFPVAMESVKSGLAAAAAVITLLACDRGTVSAVTPRPTSPPLAAPATGRPALLASANVDALLGKAWTEAGVHPTAPADDATWLRRTWLDTVGTIPPPEAIVRFLAKPAA